MTELEQRDLRALGRSCLILTGLALVPVPLLMSLLGPVLGLISLALAIPLSAHLGDLVSFGDTPERAWDRVRGEARQVGQVTGLSAVLWFLVVFFVPERPEDLPLLTILIASLFAMCLYLIGMREDPERVLPSIGLPVLLFAAIGAVLL